MNRRIVLPAWLGLVLLAGNGSTRADPDEAWVVRAGLPAEVKSLLVLVVDRSSAMNQTVVVRTTYDPAIDYGASLAGDDRCDSRKVYWRRGPGPAPDCRMQQGLALTPVSADDGLQCERARSALARHGVFVAARAAQQIAAGNHGYWTAPRAYRTSAVECRADRGGHGAAAGIWYAADGSNGPWSANVDDEIAWDRAPFADPYIFYTGNYLNWLQATTPEVSRTLSDILVESLEYAVAGSDELEVALILSSGGDGGFVALAPTPAASAAAQLAARLSGTSAGAAPLAETLAETTAWLAGAQAYFGGVETADPAAFLAGNSTSYRSPLMHACRPVTLGFLTAGQSSDDQSAAQAVAALPAFAASEGPCGTECLGSLARWLEAADLRDDLPGTQSAPLTWILPPGAASVTSGLPVNHFDDPLAFVDLVARALQRDAAVAAGPSLSAVGLTPAAGFAHAAHLTYGLSAPRPTMRWYGNVLRYALRTPETPLGLAIITDRNDAPAIDAANGLPRAGSRSLWSDGPDADLLAGGAAGRLPAPAVRQLFSDFASDRLADPANRLSPGNARLTRSLFALGDFDRETPAELLAWLAGLSTLGDPGMASPVVVDYPDAGLQLVFVATADGLLHAFDGADGVERWAWMPAALLPRLKELARDTPTTVRDHGIDGPLQLHRYDPDGNGRIDATAGEHLLLLLGLGRGGNGYYALDVSAPLEPRLLWSRSVVPGHAVESWASPVIAQLTIAGSGQSSGHWVVLLTGGYDRSFDVSGARPAGAGHDLVIVDAMTGATLWHASGSADSDAQLRVAGLDASLPSAPRVLDRNGDGELDRAYLLDVNGGLWRLDFSGGRPAPALATAGLIARLGDGSQRFYSTPDVSVLRRNSNLQTAIATGSGWLSRPLDTTVADRVYVVFESESGQATLDDDSLVDMTDATDGLPASAPGWQLRLDRQGPGEKVIGSTVTFDHVLRFQTYQPLPTASDSPCGPPRGIRRLRAYDIRTGRPWGSVVENPEDDPESLPGAGLPAALRFAFPGRIGAACDGCRLRPFGIAGTAVVDPRYGGDPVRTSWRKLPPDLP